ncbi:MAG: glycosyltransferase, partial [Thermoplasmata archaeon]|nr:glycosyltransferase [Thermoplasmata archaeon]
GIPTELREDFKRWSDAIVAGDEAHSEEERRALFQEIGGFDPRLITAEDIDLNLRAVRTGASIRYVPEAMIYHHVRATLLRFLYQAFWNGYGRKQLTEKHGSLWGNYRYSRLLDAQRTPVAWLRLAAAMTGYLSRVLTGYDKRLTPPGTIGR